MKHHKFSQRSAGRLAECHPDLQRVMTLALELSPIDFTIIEGARSRARQAELVKQGASQTMNSRHIPREDGYSYAVDIAPYVGGVRWDWPLFHQLAPAVKQAARMLGVAIVWGGDWKSFPDGPHFELDRKVYP